ncbi:MAG: hypothetical protein RLZ98_2064 [Pseudomonadota bacterium]|jgi:tripartite-type tricarboxylate transporter receptor subunit TctC
MKTTVRGLALGLGAAGVALAALGSGAVAQDFYKGQTLKIMIGHPPGGSYDAYSQLAALHYGKFIPGNPNVIVEHRPGGGGRKAGAYLFSKAPTDGSLIALLPDTMVHNQLLEPKRSRWDMAKVHYIGRLATAHTVFGVRADTGVKDVKSLLTTPVKAGCTGKTSSSASMPLLVKNLDGAQFTMVCGYRGSGPFMLAMERGEVNMLALNWGTWEANLLDKVKSGEYKLIMQIGTERNEAIKDIPLVQEEIGSAKSKAVYEWIGLSSDIGRALFGAPGMPKDRIDILRTAFDKMVKDDAFKADTKKRGFPLEPKTGAEIDKLRDRVLKGTPEIVAIANKAMTEGYAEGCLNCGGKGK